LSLLLLLLLLNTKRTVLKMHKLESRLNKNLVTQNQKIKASKNRSKTIGCDQLNYVVTRLKV